MNNTKSFVELFLGFRDYCFYKCDGQIPYYFADQLNFKTTILSKYADDYSALPIENLNFSIQVVNPKLFLGKNVTEMAYLIKHAREIGILYQYHFGYNNFARLAFYSIVYKILNKKGVLAMRLEADLGLLDKNYFTIGGNFIKKSIIKLLYKRYFKAIDILGVCDFEDLRKLREFKNLMQFIDIKKVKVQYNGFNLHHILQAVKKIKSFSEKDNVIITSGRLNDPLKGMDILFDTLKHVNLANWKVVLVGGSGEYLDRLIFDFLSKYPQYQNKIINKGYLQSRDEYFQLMNDSKIYVLPSKIDGMPHVIPEAMALGNVIVGSSHHGMRVATNDGKIGRLHEIGDSAKLSKILNELMSNDTLLEELSVASYNKAHNEFEWSKIVQHVFEDYL